MDILEKACYMLTTLKKIIFSKVAGRGLQSVASFTTKITFFTESFSKIAPQAELNSLNSLKLPPLHIEKLSSSALFIKNLTK